MAHAKIVEAVIAELERQAEIERHYDAINGQEDMKAIDAGIPSDVRLEGRFNLVVLADAVVAAIRSVPAQEFLGWTIHQIPPGGGGSPE